MKATFIPFELNLAYIVLFTNNRLYFSVSVSNFSDVYSVNYLLGRAQC